jgi:SOS response regulatory protein OraA/RecX
VIKPYLAEFIKLENSEDFLEAFNAIEKKALRRYFLFLLSKKDQLSKDLKTKAQMAGFNPPLVFELLEEFLAKGWINDKVLYEKKGIQRLKKGYSLRHTQGLDHSQEDLQELERKALISLIKKKRHLLESLDRKENQKGYRFFLSRGYSIDQVKDVLSNKD